MGPLSRSGLSRDIGGRARATWSIGAAIPGVRTIVPISCALAFPGNRTGLSILRLELAFKADPLLASG